MKTEIASARIFDFRILISESKDSSERFWFWFSSWIVLSPYGLKMKRKNIWENVQKKYSGEYSDNVCDERCKQGIQKKEKKEASK